MAMHRSVISVVIVNRDTRELLRECLDALAAQVGAPDFEVIVVDNGSGDGSIEMVSAEYPSVQLIANDDNAGYAHANNQGIATSDGTSVLLLNSDAVLSPGAMCELSTFMGARPRVGAVGVKLHNTDGSLQRLSRGRALSLGSAFNQLLLLSNIFPGVRVLRGFHVEGDFGEPEPIGWVSTACALFRREALDEVGWMQESLVTYGTDIDLCQRVGRAGWHVYSLPTDVVHHGGASFPDGARSTMWFRSLHTLFAHDNGRLATGVFDVLVAIGFTLRAVAHLALSTVRKDAPRRTRATAAWETARAAGKMVFSAPENSTVPPG